LKDLSVDARKILRYIIREIGKGVDRILITDSGFSRRC